MFYRVVHGDLLEQRVDAVVNAWNRNIIPWWLLLPQGVSGALKRRSGLAPFWELGRKGPIPLGGAVITGPGRLPCRAIIHVAGIDLWWRASEVSVRDSVRNACMLARKASLRSLAFPVLGAGSGGLSEDRALWWITDTLSSIEDDMEAVVVRFSRRSAGARRAPRLRA